MGLIDVFPLKPVFVRQPIQKCKEKKGSIKGILIFFLDVQIQNLVFL